MLQHKDIWKRGGLARRVLRRGLGIVYNSALYGMVIYCIGCVIPTPLDRAPAPTNFQPSFVTSRVTPGFGPTSEPVNSGITFALAATDPNHDDVLTVRLFEGTPSMLTYTGINTTLMIPSPPDKDDPNMRIGSIDTARCLGATPGEVHELYAIVADRDFMSNLPKVQDGGLSDSNHWELTCTSM